MHEFGLMKNIVDIAQEFAINNGAQKVTKIIVDMGEISGGVPQFLSFYFEPCTKNTIMEGAELQINLIPAMGKCKQCFKTFNLLENDFMCPLCNTDGWELISGKELNIKGIEVV